MVVLLTVVQVTVATPPPLPLYAIFAGVWVFGAAMLYARPTFGAWGTALYGVIMGVQILNMHGRTALNSAIAIGSLGATALALLFWWARRRAA